MLGIAAQEGLQVRSVLHAQPRAVLTRTPQVNDTAMEALIENCNSDIRLVLNTLQVRAATVHALARAHAAALDAAAEFGFAEVR